MASKKKYPERCNLGAQRKSWDLKVIGIAEVGQCFRHGYVVYRERTQHSKREDSGQNHQVEVFLGKRLIKSLLRWKNISEAKKDIMQEREDA